jgi:hypothetical protein
MNGLRLRLALWLAPNTITAQDFVKLAGLDLQAELESAANVQFEKSASEVKSHLEASAQNYLKDIVPKVLADLDLSTLVSIIAASTKITESQKLALLNALTEKRTPDYFR